MVGYRVRFDDKVGKNTRIKFLTDGMLLREAILDRELSQYKVIILDEAHERTVNSDVLMALVKSIVTGPRKNDLKLVVMSATLDVERLRSYFQSDCLVKLEGRTFPIEIYNTMEAQSDYIVSQPEIALTKTINTLLFSIELNGAMCNLDCAFRTRMG